MENIYKWKAKRDKIALLAFEDGTVLRGYSIGAEIDREGEVVFNTGMTGYQEILSDPSYAGQFVTMTYPEIGNTGINDEDMESGKFFANGFIIHDLNEVSNWRSKESLTEALIRQKVPGIAGVDTRAITSKLRASGTMKAYMCCSGKLSPEKAVEKAKAWEGLDNKDYASKVSCDKPYQWDKDGELTKSWGICSELPQIELKVVAYDFGIKWNILRSMRLSGMGVTVVPAKTTAEEVLAKKPDGVFLSNGPADPAAVSYAIEASRKLLGKVPIMGICLGHQILGIACGGERFRLKFGHHGCNHPVKRLETGSVEITSQNHNYAIKEDSFPSTVEVTHINLNDQTVEGIRHKKEPMFAVQYHPEASPGPHDPLYLFKQFKELMKK
jgi:carbamoyl-phosphate synthase small subunit